MIPSEGRNIMSNPTTDAERNRAEFLRGFSETCGLPAGSDFGQEWDLFAADGFNTIDEREEFEAGNYEAGKMIGLEFADTYSAPVTGADPRD